MDRARTLWPVKLATRCDLGVRCPARSGRRVGAVAGFMQVREMAEDEMLDGLVTPA
ncbi:MAG: hypothetical protein KDK12_05870 [Rhodobacteraceae bacterium]|nr:hypothetical protein [Paracoccaceae bacterium]